MRRRGSSAGRYSCQSTNDDNGQPHARGQGASYKRMRAFCCASLCTTRTRIQNACRINRLSCTFRVWSSELRCSLRLRFLNQDLHAASRSQDTKILILNVDISSYLSAEGHRHIRQNPRSADVLIGLRFILADGWNDWACLVYTVATDSPEATSTVGGGNKQGCIRTGKKDVQSTMSLVQYDDHQLLAQHIQTVVLISNSSAFVTYPALRLKSARWHYCTTTINTVGTQRPIRSNLAILADR